MKRVGYFNGTIGNLDEMTIPLCDRSVFFGDAIYDAVLVCNKKTFALSKHLDRLYSSCKLMKINFTIERETLVEEIDKVIAESEDDVTMLYIQVTRGTAPRKHEFPAADIKPNLIMSVTPVNLPPKDKYATLISFDDYRFHYCNIKTVNLIPNVFAAQVTAEGGYTEALLHRGERVTEAAHSSILIIKDGIVIMPPLDEYILPGITRAIIAEVCEEAGIPVEISIFTREELMEADEIILCSTTKNVIFVREVDGKKVGGNDPETAENIQKLFLERLYKETGAKL